MIEIKATGDTTLYTAGMYCEEDILVKVPSCVQPSGTITITENGTYDVADYASAEVNVVSSGSGAIFEKGTFTYTVEEDYEPNADLYTLSSSELKTSSRYIIIIEFRILDNNTEKKVATLMFHRTSLDDDFIISYCKSGSTSVTCANIGMVKISEDCIVSPFIQLYSSETLIDISFIAV